MEKIKFGTVFTIVAIQLSFAALIYTQVQLAISLHQDIRSLHVETSSNNMVFHGRLCALEERYLNFMMRKHERD